MPKTTRPLALKDCLAVRDTCLASNLRRADRLATQIYDLPMKRHGLKSTQFGVMVALHAMQPASVSALAAQLGIDRTTMTRNLEVMKRLGWVEPAKSEDQRESRMSLTDEGERLIAAAYPDWERSQQAMIRLLGAARVEGLLSETKKFVQAAG